MNGIFDLLSALCTLIREKITCLYECVSNFFRCVAKKVELGSMI